MNDFLIFFPVESRKEFLPLIAVVCFNKFFAAQKVAFMTSSCCVIFELNKFAHVR